MNPAARHAALAFAAVVALLAVKNLRHADEARLAVAPAAKVAFHEIEDGHASDALTAAEIFEPRGEKNGKD